MSIRLLSGDCREMLRSLPDRSVQMCVTSPPYFGLRDYGTGTWSGGDPECAHSVGGQVQDNKAPGAITSGVRPGVDAWTCRHCGATRTDSQIGLEPSPDAFVAEMVAVFREVRRVLRDDGVLFLNLGDSYATSGGHTSVGVTTAREGRANLDAQNMVKGYRPTSGPIKPKDLIGIPWMVAFALRADGWWLRSDIIWHKPNPMPESVTDRPTTSHEHVFLLTKSSQYFFDAEAIAEPSSPNTHLRLSQDLANQIGSFRANGGAKTNGPMKAVGKKASAPGSGIKHNTSYDAAVCLPVASRNSRTVWTISTHSFSEAHFATFPPELAERCVKAGTSERGCCSACGAPWERVITKGEPDLEHKRVSGGDSSGEYRGQSIKDHDAHGVQNASDVKRRILEGMREKTYDWIPTCSCDAAVVPCAVLDPFAGAFTSMLVADRLQRNGIGIELNPTYVAMAERRLRTDGGMFINLTFE